MANMLVVTWDRLRVSALQVGSGEHGRISGVWTSEWPEGVSPGQGARAAGVWLQKQWTTAGLTAEALWVVLPREDVVLRHLELPQAPDDELPEMVKFQAASRSTVPVDQLCLDFLPLSPFPGRTGRDVLAATLPKIAVDQVRLLAAGAEREFVGLSFSSHALGEWGEQFDRLKLAADRRPHADATLVVGWDQGRVELSVVNGRELTFAHVAKIPVTEGVDPTPAVLAEVSRTLVAGQRLRPGLKVDHGWLIGGDQALAHALSERLECTVERVDPVSQHSQAEQLKPLLNAPVTSAVLLGVHTPAVTPAINFLKPRQAPPKRDPRKRQMAIAAAAILLVAFLGVGGGLLRLQSLDRQIEALYDKKLDQQEMVDAGQPVLAASKVVDDWAIRNVQQLQQLTELEAIMPSGPQRPYLSEYESTVATGDFLAKVTGKGAARTRADIETLQQDLRHQAGFQVFPKEVTTSRDPQYPHNYTLDLSLPKKKPAAPTAATPAPNEKS